MIFKSLAGKGETFIQLFTQDKNSETRINFCLPVFAVEGYRKICCPG
jgi:hypothetical protein